MPKKYLDIRDACYQRKRKKNKGKLSDKDKAYCKKTAAITYYKITGKPVTHADMQLAILDEVNFDKIDLDIMQEQLDIFGSYEEYENWRTNE